MRADRALSLDNGLFCAEVWPALADVFAIGFAFHYSTTVQYNTARYGENHQPAIQSGVVRVNRSRWVSHRRLLCRELRPASLTCIADAAHIPNVFLGVLEFLTVSMGGQN